MYRATKSTNWLRRGRASCMAAWIAMVAVVWGSISPIRAQESISLIRDAEIESGLRMMTSPLLEAAGIEPASVNIYIVKDDRLNAFVAGGMNLFLNTGLLIRTEHSGQLTGVIAHEIGHIAGGHLSRASGAQSKAAAELILATVLGAAAAVAGAPALGTAIFAGGQTYAQDGYLRFSRSQEQAADQAALTYLARIGVSAKGLSEFFRILDNQSLISTSEPNPYVRSHPLTRDRINFVNSQPERSAGTLPKDWETFHRRMVVKLKAFLEMPERVLETYRGSELEDRYARAIAYYRRPDMDKALAEIDGLISDHESDPYFHELKGQMLFENGRVEEAIVPYRDAASLKPDPLMQIGLAKALIEHGGDASLHEAEDALEAAVQTEPNNASAWHLLGIAQGRVGEEGLSSLSFAEWALLVNKPEDAQLHAHRARAKLSKDDPAWLRLQDVLRVIDEKLNER